MADAVPRAMTPTAIGAAMRRRLAGFVRTLRDNGFKVGLAETRDALAVLASPAAARPSSLQAGAAGAVLRRPIRTGSASTRSSTAYLASAAACGSAQALSGAPTREPRRRCGASREPGVAQAERACPITSSGASADGDDAPARTAAAAKAPRAPRTLAHDRPAPHRRSRRHRARHTRSPRGWRAPCGRGSCGASRCAGAGGGSTCAAPSTATSRHGGTPIDLVWRRRKIKPLRLVVLLDASGSMNLYTAFFVRFLHGVVDAFREAEAFVFHTRLAHVSASLRDRDVARAVDRLVADGAGDRRRHAHRRKPRHLQSLARAPRDQFAHRRDDRLGRLRHRRAGAARRTRCGACAAAAAASSGSTR